MKKVVKKLLVIALMLPLLIWSGDMESYAAENPVIIEGNDRPGNEQLPSKLDGLKQWKLEIENGSPKSGNYHNGMITLHFNDAKSFNWNSKLRVKYVFVKGGNGGHLYTYSKGETMGKNLSAPMNNGGNQPDIGHITFYYEEVPIELFENPIIGDGADPWIVRHSDGYYYYTQTTGNNITIWKSKTISGLKDAPSKVVWKPEEGAPNSEHIWAPEIHFIDGKWYIYFAASAGDMGKQRMYVLQSETSDPFSEYSYPEGTSYGKITTPADKWSIDGTILKYEGQYYFAWSGWEGDVNVSQNIYIAPMTNPWNVSGDRVELSHPEYDWETVGFPHVNEGPQFLKNDQGDLFLIYSASGSWTDDYNLGMLTFTGNNPLEPSAWEKSPEPVFEKRPEAGVFGPGHNGFFQSPDGTENWIIYHAAKYEGAGWNRNVRMQKFSWNEDGTPNFGTPVSTETLLKVPSGEQPGTLTPGFPPGYQFEAENAYVHQAKIVENTAASGGKKVGYIDYEDSYVAFDVDVPPGEYTLKVRYSNGMGKQATHHIALNGKDIGEISYKSYGWDNWRFAEMDVSLEQASNTIRISKGKLFTELDYIELVEKNPSVLRYEAEHAEIEEARTINDIAASNGQTIGDMDEKNSAVAYRIKVGETGDYKLSVSYKNNTEQMSSHHIMVNGELAREVAYLPNEQGDWEISSETVHLEKGVNTIELSRKAGAVEVDYISLSKK
ncbi:family 43 glycosylhydrolase [Thalassobacillus pellis]|uniref:family 43 glycosylhydrolase n=1 Tax=Thalassobacillus pellis TaxID=748008 RepID=UPI001960B5BE|nr:family 43 glycosylhydrolase [Thalassobacillus pellis]MBM7551456.1 GH43 family beta-xylosidase [Thalassobacillus pellis]